MLALVLGFVGALCGGVAAAVVTGRYSRLSTEQRELSGRREEWGRRFTLAVELMAPGEQDRKQIGVSLLDTLAESELAAPDDVRLVQSLMPLWPSGAPTATDPHIYVRDREEDHE